MTPTATLEPSVQEAPPGLSPDDLAYAESFERLEIPGGTFHHQEHVYLAWICLRQAPLAEAAARFIRLLKAFAAHQGAHGLYHDTITWAFLLIIHDRLTEMPEEHDWAELAAQNADLLQYKPSILSRYYREETLKSDRARRGFVMPDAWLESPGA